MKRESWLMSKQLTSSWRAGSRRAAVQQAADTLDNNQLISRCQAITRPESGEQAGDELAADVQQVNRQLMPTGEKAGDEQAADEQAADEQASDEQSAVAQLLSSS